MAEDIELITIAEDFRLDAREEGREEGGEKKARAIAANLIKMDIDLAIIHRATGVPLQELSCMKDEFV